MDRNEAVLGVLSELLRASGMAVMDSSPTSRQFQCGSNGEIVLVKTVCVDHDVTMVYAKRIDPRSNANVIAVKVDHDRVSSPLALRSLLFRAILLPVRTPVCPAPALAYLQKDLQHAIASFAAAPDIVALSSVCRSMRERLIHDGESLWKELLARDFGQEPRRAFLRSAEGGTALQEYRAHYRQRVRWPVRLPHIHHEDLFTFPYPRFYPMRHEPSHLGPPFYTDRRDLEYWTWP